MRGFRSFVVGVGTACACLLLALPAYAQGEFEILPGSVGFSATNSDGTTDTRAGSHPFEVAVRFKFRTDSEGNVEGGNPRDIVADLPQGFVGDPLAVPRCPREQFEGTFAVCPAETQIGVLHVTIPEVGFGAVTIPVYNLIAPPGMPAQLGASGLNLNVLQSTGLLSDEGYKLTVGAFNIPNAASEAEEVIWGVPADAAHDGERTLEVISHGGSEPSSAPRLPFLTLPTSCGAAPQITLSADSDLNPGVFTSQTAALLDGGGNPAPLTGCDSVPFSPSITAAPSTRAGDESTGLDFKLELPDNGLLNPIGVTESEPEKTEVILPPGVTVNPSAANGIATCSQAQYEAASGDPSSGCPDASKLGTLVAKTPLLEEPIEGSVYLAAPHENPFNSLLALYIVAKSPERGILIKQAGEVHADPTTGQLTTTFDGLPPLPYSSFEFDLREGPKAPLTTPSTCGTYSTVAKLYPFSNPEAPVIGESPFTITSGAHGAACAASEAQLPNSPSLEAGTVAPIAGAFSPFVFKLSREDGTQRFSSINTTLPPGLTGRLAGIAQCSDAQIAAAAARASYGEGSLEQAIPSCPAASEIGTVNVGAGSGSPIQVSGRAYLAGPYKGAPFSLAIVTPAIAGPFDLGAVVVRSALFINPETAQVTVKSDPLPTILEGIPLDIRSIALSISRPEFMLNPTSCDAMALNGEAISTTGQSALFSNRFQVGGCSGLAFKPLLSAATQAKASKVNGASLTVKVIAKPGEANIRKVNLQLPVKLPSRLSTLQKSCTEAQFNANPAGCPAESAIGSAVAHTPLLQTPLSGPAYLVSHGGAGFPDVEFVLQANERGGTVEIVLDGGTQIKKGITYSNFETVPDAPITSFESVFPEGPHSILAAYLPASSNYNLCGQMLLMPTTLTGQNGAVVKQSTPIEVTGCAPSITVTNQHVSGKTATLVVHVPSAGSLAATGAGLTAAKKAVTAAKSVTLKVSLTGKEKAFLAHHPHRKLKLRVKLRFTPKKGSRLSSSVSVLIG